MHVIEPALVERQHSGNIGRGPAIGGAAPGQERCKARAGQNGSGRNAKRADVRGSCLPLGIVNRSHSAVITLLFKGLREIYKRLALADFLFAKTALCPRRTVSKTG